MTDNARNSGGKSRGQQNASNEALLALSDTIEDLQSILDTLDELGIKNRDDLIQYIDALEIELGELEALEDY
jgi:hypothetical protein